MLWPASASHLMAITAFGFMTDRNADNLPLGDGVSGIKNLNTGPSIALFAQPRKRLFLFY